MSKARPNTRAWAPEPRPPAACAGLSHASVAAAARCLVRASWLQPGWIAAGQWLQLPHTVSMPRPSLRPGPGLGVVGTTKYSEQNHNPKERGLKLKEYSRPKSHESISEYGFQDRHHVRSGRPRSAPRGLSTLSSGWPARGSPLDPSTGS
jgi:hypothetical protein